MITLTVLIPTNRISESTLRTVKSISYSDITFEVLIVIDSRAEINSDVVENLQTIRSVRLLKSTNRPGIAQTLNYGLQHATGEFILRIDDGDLNLRTDLLEEFELLKHCDLVCAPMLSICQHRNKSFITKPSLIYREGHLSPFSRIPHPTWIFRRTAIIELYQDQDHRCEDFGFLVRNKFQIGQIDKVAIEYDVSSSLNYTSELKSAWAKWTICFECYKFHWIMLECTLYVFIRSLRLTLTTKKVLNKCPNFKIR